MLTERQSRILELVIREYVESADPVGSQYIGRKHQLSISPATIRNEMAELEDQGYLTHPHTSAGRLPTGKGYRFYVETLMHEEEVPWETQQTIRHQFHQVGAPDTSGWMHLAASVLAQAVRNAAVVTAPRTAVCRLKHLELVDIHERTALLVLVLDQGRLEQQVLQLDEASTQDALTAAAALLNQRLGGCTAAEIATQDAAIASVERLVVETVLAVMHGVDEGASDEAYLEGLRHVLSQPEFADSERALGLLELLDERNLTRAIPLRALAQGGVAVIIGADSPSLERAGDAMRACSVVVGTYGAPGVASGTLAVFGPMRMRYPRTISTVRYLAGVMSELLSERFE
jgi:heat-inducible transcriptional repressor